MSYTGTGTEQDPYLVSNLDDFIACVGKSDAYVKVIADIDAREETEYPTYNEIVFQARKVYADTLTKVSGFIVSDKYCFYHPSLGSKTTIGKIHFTDILFKPTSDLSGIIHAETSYPFEYVDCKVSISTSYDAQDVDGVYNATFRQCGVYLNFDGDTRASYTKVVIFSSSVSFYECAVEVRGYPAANAGNSNTIGYAEYTAFKISLVKYFTDIGNNRIFSDGASHDNILIISQELAPDAAGYLRFVINGTSQLVDSEASENTTISFSNTGGRNHLLTTEQIQSEDYLREIGFIP